MQEKVEYGDVVDEQDRVIGTAPRPKIRAQKLLHRGVAILCREPSGHLYVHRRTDTKDVFPGLYDMFVAGMLRAGEAYELGAARELEEELGVVAEPHFLFKHHYRGDDNPSIKAVFEVQIEGEVRPQPDEIAWGAFLSEDELFHRLAEWRFVPDGVEMLRRYLRERGRGQGI